MFTATLVEVGGTPSPSRAGAQLCTLPSPVVRTPPARVAFGL